MSATVTREERIKWWREGRYGMFIHWGLYAIPAGTWKEAVHDQGYSEWIMFHEKIPVAEYAALASQFNPAQFDAEAWVDVAKRAGMTYIVLTTKHHDGFSMFDSDVTDYTIVKSTPWKRDATRELVDACRAAGIKFGCYYSTDRDWYRRTGPGKALKQTNTWDYPDSPAEDFDRYYQDVVKPQVAELLTKYHPDLLWFDEIEFKTRDQVMDLHDMIREMAPWCIINSRIKTYTFPETDSSVYSDYISSGDNEIFEKGIDYEWENPGTLNTSYGFNRNDHNWVAPSEVLRRLVSIVSMGGNYLLNVGPTAEGVIPQPSVDTLDRIGKWMSVNDDAIYGTMPLPEGNVDPDQEVYFTSKGDALYAICLGPISDETSLRLPGSGASGANEITSVSVLGSDEAVTWSQTDSELRLSTPSLVPDDLAVVYRLELRRNATS